MNDESLLADAATAIEIEVKRFGRLLSRQRAMELATELERYEAAMERLCAPSMVECDPGKFMQTLVDLGRG